MSDESDEALSSVVLVVINLNDVNEDDPVLVKPSSGSVTVTIDENISRGATGYNTSCISILARFLHDI